MKKLLLFIILVFFALGERLWFDMGWNVELVTVGTLMTSVYLGRRWSLVFVIVVMGVSDFFLGNTNIWWFTWSAFLVQGVVGVWLRWFKGWPRVGVSVLAGAGASLWFYVWTNFGVWLLDDWGMYSNDLAGLVQSYINGLPFLRASLLSNFLILPMGFGIVGGVQLLQVRAKQLMGEKRQVVHV